MDRRPRRGAQAVMVAAHGFCIRVRAPLNIFHCPKSPYLEYLMEMAEPEGPSEYWRRFV